MLSIVPSTSMTCRCRRLHPSLWPVEIVFPGWALRHNTGFACHASIRTAVQGMATCLQQETTLFWIPLAMVPMSGPGSNWPNLMGLKCDGYRLTRTGSCGSSLEKKLWLFLLTEYEFHGCRVSPSNIKTAQRINSITAAWRAKNDRFHFNIFSFTAMSHNLSFKCLVSFSYTSFS